MWRKQDNTCYTIYNVMYPTVNFVSYNGMLIFKKNIHNIPGYCVRILSAEIRRKIQKKMLSKPGFLGQIWLTSLLAIYFLFHTRSSQDRGVSKKRRDWNWLWRTFPVTKAFQRHPTPFCRKRLHSPRPSLSSKEQI